MAYKIIFIFFLEFFFSTAGTISIPTTQRTSSETHTYFIAAEEVEWDYAPVFHPLDNAADIWLNSTDSLIGSTYKKAIYVEYTDITFRTKKPVPLKWKHKHILGPILRARVGDHIHVYFKNMATYPYTMHPHGVKYEKSSEGAFLTGITPAGGVPPGQTQQYRWSVTDRAGPGPDDPSSIVWFYHSHSEEGTDSNSGLVGAIIISGENEPIDADGMPMDIDKEFILFWTMFDEGSSHYLADNINSYTTNPNAELHPLFHESNLMHAVNGRVFNNVEGLDMEVGDTVRWYIMALGSEMDVHTIHWHALTTIRSYSRTDVILLLPASMTTVDTLIDSAGDWYVHCHVNDHIWAGMIAKYSVTGISVEPEFSGTVHNYFIQAEEVEWNYSPTMPMNNAGDTWLDGTAANRIGRVYKKVRYIEYTNNTFSTVKPIDPAWLHLGLLGPVIRAQVGDEIRVEFRNNATVPYSMHPHGVFYYKSSEGAWTHGIEEVEGVQPGETKMYNWMVSERAGPSSTDPSSIVWLYHSHVDEILDTHSGLVGPIIISRRNTTVDNFGKPIDIDKEVVLYFSVINEGLTHYINDNIATYTNTTAQDVLTLVEDGGFHESNLMHSINGFAFNNVQGIDLVVDDKVRWYIIVLGSEIDIHTIHWHALTAIYKQSRTDVIPLLPGDMATVDTTIDSAGSWFVHCHVNDHITAGMVASYHVTGNTITPTMNRVIHRYYVTVEELEWDYAPYSTPNNNVGDIWLDGHADDRIGKTYKKAIYKEYTDSSFSIEKPPSAKWAHKGILGPIFRAQVGDTIQVMFKNNAIGTNYSLHPHGVFYHKSSEGAWADGMTVPGGVMPGQTYTYDWIASARAGPTDDDPSSIVWLYHSHVDETLDTNSGAVGAIIISRAGIEIDDDGMPTDIDREFILFMTVMNEAKTHYFDDNIAKFTSGHEDHLQKTLLKDDPAFQESNLMHSINGYIFDNVRGIDMIEGETVRWYLMALGTEIDLHTFHWHALTTVFQGSRTDIIELLPGTQVTVDSVIDSPGTWFVHCHVNDHITAGMIASYHVNSTLTLDSKATLKEIEYGILIMSIFIIQFFWCKICL